MGFIIYAIYDISIEYFEDNQNKPHSKLWTLKLDNQ